MDSESESRSSSSASGSSDSESGSSSSTESETQLLRPIFIKKRPNDKKIGIQNDSSQSVLAKAEYMQSIESKSVEELPFDGVDDSDDIDPEDEYRQWRLRESFRKQRDADLRAQRETEKEDMLRRKIGYSEGNSSEDGNGNGSDVSDKKIQKSAKIGAFYSENIDEKLLKRDFKDVEGREDHSRPTKYKRS